jgi:hypothetical protein
MGPFDAVWHLLNFFVPALGMALIAPSLAKLLWRRELAGAPWRRLALWAGLASAGTLVAGLVVFGRDGRMATYAALTIASALALWWAGFGPGRR